MLKNSASVDWREARRQSARATVLAAAWEMVRADGLAALSLRDLARQAGITTPTVYAYFDSKNAIFDAMFGEAAQSFAESKAELVDQGDPYESLMADAQNFIEFCVSDVARYQLLFQHSVPGFSPSPQSYAPAVRALELTREQLAGYGVHHPRHVDMWTALLTGLVDQQISNDPGGDRWTRLVDDVVRMFLTHCSHEEDLS
jgi:AcrR family transcriptional regulator